MAPSTCFSVKQMDVFHQFGFDAKTHTFVGMAKNWQKCLTLTALHTDLNSRGNKKLKKVTSYLERELYVIHNTSHNSFASKSYVMDTEQIIDMK